MKISWFPGHMDKARKELRRLAASVQVVVELRDARAPLATANPELEKIFPEHPKIRVLGKSDLADSATTAAWQDYFETAGQTCLQSSRNEPLKRQALLAAANRVARVSGSRSRAMNMAVVGIPNVGKSTLLNQLTGRNLARTANEPAVTRSQQRVRLTDGWFLIDTPGLMWPRLEDQQAAYLMAMLGTIRNTAYDIEEVAWFAADTLMRLCPAALLARYRGLAVGADAESVLLAVATSRGAVSKGRQIDWHRSAEFLLNDLRSGKLGALSLEVVPE